MVCANTHPNCVLCTVYCVLCTVYCVLCTVYCVLCTVYCVLCTVYCVLCTVYCVLCTVYCVLCTVYCVLCTVYCVLCTVYCVLCTVYCVLCTVSHLKGFCSTKVADFFFISPRPSPEISKSAVSGCFTGPNPHRSQKTLFLPDFARFHPISPGFHRGWGHPMKFGEIWWPLNTTKPNQISGKSGGFIPDDEHHILLKDYISHINGTPMSSQNCVKKQSVSRGQRQDLRKTVELAQVATTLFQQFFKKVT